MSIEHNCHALSAVHWSQLESKDVQYLQRNRLTTKVPTNIGFPMMVIGLCLKLGSFRPLDSFSIFRFEHDNIEEQQRMWVLTIEFAPDCTRFSLSELHLNLMVFYVILQKWNSDGVQRLNIYWPMRVCWKPMTFLNIVVFMNSFQISSIKLFFINQIPWFDKDKR